MGNREDSFSTSDQTFTANGVNLDSNGRPVILLDGGNHLDDVDNNDLLNRDKSSQIHLQMRRHVQKTGLHRVVYPK